uniref:Helicase-associated domain-containing protein n=1 Tax=Attheya septentrionalis TaxID=420275 RepID=A0A6T7IQ67_9STRA|mmetsp:Transcript_26734/g.48552  ORF Transcript_26734/g.48552 Transcript_26734/m.48552 type:complete len:362 (+) Transcript_26734:301-1386(+)
MPIKVTLRVKRSSLPGQEQGHLLRVAKKQRTEIPNIFIKRETLSTESGNKARNVDKDIAAQSGREKNVTDDLRKSSSCTSHSSNTSRNQCISNATGDECADFIVGTSDGTVISRPNRKIPPMKNSSGSECDEHDNLQKKNEFVSLNFEKAEEEEVVPSSSTHDQSSLTKERLANNTWNTKFEQLQAFKNAQGRTNVPQKSGPLGTWGNDQRRKIRPKWDTRFQELKEFAKANGHANVPPNKLGPLGQWVSNQRTQFRLLKHGKASSMTDERIAKLNGINFEFNPLSQPPSWDMRFQELKEFMKVNGHTNVPEKSGSLGDWVSYQRMQFRLSKEGNASSLINERLAKLNRINFQFNIYSKHP